MPYKAETPPPPEASLLWDEYKYRHDLIWRHLIRSTVAVVALITLAYSNDLTGREALFIIGALLAVVYTVFSYIVLTSELALFEKIKVKHRERQDDLYGLHSTDKALPRELVGGFSRRARIYALGLLALALAAAASHIIG